MVYHRWCQAAFKHTLYNMLYFNKFFSRFRITDVTDYFFYNVPDESTMLFVTMVSMLKFFEKSFESMEAHVEFYHQI